MSNSIGDSLRAAIRTVLDIVEIPLELDEMDVDQIKGELDARVTAYSETKALLGRWMNSPNAPNRKTMYRYVYRLVEAGENTIEQLNQGLAKEIDLSEIDTSRRVSVVKSKGVILNYIYKMQDDVSSLKRQLENEQFQLEDREFKLGYPERYAKGEFFPLSNYHKDWYNEKEDAIMICPHSTKGDIIEIDTDGNGSKLKVQLPKKPKKADILFSDLQKKDQYWRRQNPPSGLSPDSEDAFSEYIMEEFRRRREGLWFMNNGEPVYLTGHAYFALQWGKMRDTGGYMDFRYAQLEMFYFAEAVIRDPRCLGMHFTKARRTGFTYVILFIMLNDATSTRNVNLGLTSQNDGDAARAFKKFTYAFRNLPSFFKPVVKGLITSDKTIEFAMPDDSSKQTKLARSNKGADYLNTLVDYEATKDGAYDGQKMYRYLGDEAGKWKKPANYENHWGRISPTFDEGGEIVGKAFIGSTVNPMNQGGQAFKDLCYASLISERDSITERTPSGLYQYFLPAHKNFNRFTDKYGRCHTFLQPGEKFENYNGQIQTMGSVQYLEARRKAKKKRSEIAYNEELRANPMKLEEAMRDSSATALFSIQKIEEQMNYLNNEIIMGRNVIQGNFAWEGGIPDTKVMWYPDPHGRFKVTWLPPANLRNNVVMLKGRRHPGNSDLGCFGCDSYDISGTVSGDGSKGALHGVTGFSMQNVPSNHFFLEYINRTGFAEQFFEDVLMAIVFYGMPILAENNKPRLLYHLKNRGYRGYSLTRPDRPNNRLSLTEKELGGIPSSGKDIIITHASMVENYVRTFVGVYDEEDEKQRVREYGSMGAFYFMDTLKDWRNFDITKREKHDATISSGYALMGLNRASFFKTPEIKPINLGFQTYDNSGMISKAKIDADY